MVVRIEVLETVTNVGKNSDRRVREGFFVSVFIVFICDAWAL